MKVELRLSAGDDAQVIKNLWPLYQHEVSEFDGARTNRHGVFNDDPLVATLEQHAASMDPWWGDAGALFPYLIRVDGAPAGFNLIASRSRFDAAIPADFVVHEFFLLHAFRGGDVAERAAILGFDQHQGRWEVVTYPRHARAIAFWRRVVGRYTAQRFMEAELDHPWGRRVVFRFENIR